MLTTDKLKGVRLQLSDNQLKISSSNAEQEEAQEEIDIDYSHEPLDVGFNVSYLLDVLANVKTDTIQWSVQPDVNASALITSPEDDQFKYVVMPMRISASRPQRFIKHPGTQVRSVSRSEERRVGKEGFSTCRFRW